MRDSLPAVLVPAAEVLAVAREYMEAGRLDAAARMLDHILAARPGEAAALHLRASIAQRRGRLAEATGLLRAALAAEQTAPLLRDLAELLRLQGQPGEAVAAARAALRLDPGDPLSLFVVAMAQYLSLIHIDAADERTHV
jgi:predicted Zn-dependent protease